jgi:hypothetical protein
MCAVAELGELVANIVSVGQFHEIAERWEQLKQQREKEAQR